MKKIYARTRTKGKCLFSRGLVKNLHRTYVKKIYYKNKNRLNTSGVAKYTLPCLPRVRVSVFIYIVMLVRLYDFMFHTCVPNVGLVIRNTYL